MPFLSQNKKPLAVDVYRVLHGMEGFAFVDQSDLHDVADSKVPRYVHIFLPGIRIPQNPLGLLGCAGPIHHGHRTAPLDRD